MANPQVSKFTKISTELLEALCRTRISGEARQMLDTIIRKTYGWSKPTDRIATMQFMKITGLRRGAVQRARKKLLNMGIISVSQKGYSQGLTYRIVKDYDKWKVYSKKDTVSKKGYGVYPKKSTEVYPKKSPTIDNTIDTTIDTLPSSPINTLLKENIGDFFTYYLQKTGKNFKLSPERKKLIEKRLKDYPIEDLKKAVDNFIKDTWEGRSQHMDLVYCIGIRNKVDNLEKWLNTSGGRRFV